jgi:hypothetical protein
LAAAGLICEKVALFPAFAAAYCREQLPENQQEE